MAGGDVAQQCELMSRSWTLNGEPVASYLTAVFFKKVRAKREILRTRQGGGGRGTRQGAGDGPLASGGRGAAGSGAVRGRERKGVTGWRAGQRATGRAPHGTGRGHWKEGLAVWPRSPGPGPAAVPGTLPVEGLRAQKQDRWRGRSHRRKVWLLGSVALGPAEASCGPRKDRLVPRPSLCSLT